MVSLNVFPQKPKVENDPSHDDRPIHFGFSLGFNFMDFNIKQSRTAVDSGIIADVALLRPGFHVHAISNLRLAEYLDLRVLPGISFGGLREIIYKEPEGRYPIISQEDNPVRIESNFLELPILFKYKSKRINNFRPYLIGGSNIRFDLAATKKTWGRSKKDNNLILLNVIDYYYEIGFGIDFYLEYFKFSTQLKYSIGLRDVLKRKIKKRDNGVYYIYPPDDDAIFTNVFERINSRMFMISFHFE